MSGRVLLIVLALFLAIFVPLALRLAGERDRGIDAERLRRTYAALALYETEHDGRPARNLGLVRRDVDATDLQSVADPQVGKGADFPLDPARPSLGLRFRSRVSWSYRGHWPEANAGDPLDPRRGLLADWWPGVLLRVGMDGSLVQKPRPESLSFEGLFGK